MHAQYPSSGFVSTSLPDHVHALRATLWLPSGARQWAHTLASDAAAPLSSSEVMATMMMMVLVGYGACHGHGVKYNREGTISFTARASLGRTGTKPPRADLGLGAGFVTTLNLTRTLFSSLPPTWATWARRRSILPSIVASPLPTVKILDATIVASPLPTVKIRQRCGVAGRGLGSSGKTPAGPTEESQRLFHGGACIV